MQYCILIKLKSKFLKYRFHSVLDNAVRSTIFYCNNPEMILRGKNHEGLEFAVLWRRNLEKSRETEETEPIGMQDLISG
jgi:hypothetical protein